jgi:hypothetical protein
MVQVDTINTAIVIITHPRLSLHSEIGVRGTATPRHEDVGAVIRKTLNAGMVPSDNAVI